VFPFQTFGAGSDSGHQPFTNTEDRQGSDGLAMARWVPLDLAPRLARVACSALHLNAQALPSGTGQHVHKSSSLILSLSP